MKMFDRHGDVIQKGDILITSGDRFRRVHKVKSSYIETVGLDGRHWRLLYNTKKCTILG